MKLRGRGAVITGGASGIGAASVRQFIAEGALVVAVDIDEVKGGDLLAELGEEQCHFLRCDVGDFDEVQSMIQQANTWLTSRDSGMDILFNNAGIGSYGKTPDLEIQDWHKVINIDLHSVFYACHEAIPLMQKRGGGSIVNTASICGIRGDCKFGPYSAAKAAVINYSRTMAMDHGEDNIRVNALCPGLVATPLVGDMEELYGDFQKEYMRTLPLGRAAVPDELASVALFLVSDEASYITGTSLAVDGGRSAGTGQPYLEDWEASRIEAQANAV